MIRHQIGSVVRVLHLRPDQVQHMPGRGVKVFGIVKAGPVQGLYAVLLMSNEIVHVHHLNLTTTRDEPS